MASAKSSRSRPTGHSGVLPLNAVASVGGCDGGVQLADKLNIFKTDNFDPDAYVQSKCKAMNEKEIRHLSAYLQDLKKASAEEMRRSVYANYSAFIRTSKEISDLERELLSIRNLINTQSALIHGLSEGVQIDYLIVGPEDSLKEDVSTDENQEPSEIQKWCTDFPDMLDVLLAERRMDEALEALDEAERITADAKQKQILTTADILSLKRVISYNRQKLADQLAEAACQSSTFGIQLRAAASALKRLGDGPRAHTAGCLRAAAECVHIALGHSSLLEARGLSLSAVLMKQFRPCVEQALESNLTRIKESTASLAAVDDWVLTYPLSGIRPFARSSASNSVLQPKLSSSAHRFNSMVQDFFEDVGPLHNLQLGGSAMDGLLKIFSSYVNLLISALPGSLDNEANLEGLENKNARMAETEQQQLALLANASLLAEDLLPRAAMKLSSVNQTSLDDMRKRGADKQNHAAEQREWKRKLHRMVDKLKDIFCRQHTLDLIFTEEGDNHLSAEMYINMDDTVEEPEWVPSLVFQELYAKLNRMASIAADMFVGRERFATLLMMRLTDTVILYLSENQSFWQEIEEGPKALGPLGLQQFYLDMQFVILFGKGRFLSRHVHGVILDIIERVMAAFSATGMNPESVLPTDDWFIDVGSDTISRISGKARAAYGEREVIFGCSFMPAIQYSPDLVLVSSKKSSKADDD
ncbi:hypothetical protein GUJ93_ZPchr0013g35647 [Zizania palustris]|uniref:Exocyst component Exo84 C-terminal domain-containing protein n=1 Tax=Zizania palustris TaxID=103762 RepID=A0A8J5X074_ZIZPA|nr:hypothetical protein GUJ93_ZPchr0013g35647 [Zizania palustris]